MSNFKSNDKCFQLSDKLDCQNKEFTTPLFQNSPSGNWQESKQKVLCERWFCTKRIPKRYLIQDDAWKTGKSNKTKEILRQQRIMLDTKLSKRRIQHL